MKWLRGIVLMLVCWPALAAPSAQGAIVSHGNSSDDIAAYRALVRQDLRLATVGYRLAKANAAFCTRTTRNPGWVLHDRAQYPDAAIAQAAFGFRAPVAVSGVVAGSYADAIGIAPGDGIIAVNGTQLSSLPFTAQNRASDRLENVLDIIADALDAKGRADITVINAQGQRTVVLSPPAICASRFWVDTKATLDAGADGVSVRVTEGIMDFTDGDDAQLAAAVAHEMSHNLLGHRQRLAATGKGTRQILATEIEADRLSVWLMANAGYDTLAALRFAERFGRKTDQGIFSDGTHLRWKKRYEVMKQEIGALNKTGANNGLRAPILLTSAEIK